MKFMGPRVAVLGIDMRTQRCRARILPQVSRAAMLPRCNVILKSI